MPIFSLLSAFGRRSWLLHSAFESLLSLPPSLPIGVVPRDPAVLLLGELGLKGPDEKLHSWAHFAKR